ncbi:nucleoside transporter C-terminal domain-containing protein [Nostoc sp. DSM 114160]
MITTYALYNFANIGSIDITIGGMTARKFNCHYDLNPVGVKSIIGGFLAVFITVYLSEMWI